MEGTAIPISEDLLERLRSIADERHISVETLVKEALEEKIKRRRPLPKSLGIGESQYTDTARTLATEPVGPDTWR